MPLKAATKASKATELTSPQKKLGPIRTKSKKSDHSSDDNMPKAAAKKRGAKEGGRKKKDPNAPKRGLSAYMFFANDNRDKVREDHPGIKFGEVGKKLGENWKALSDKDKKPYEDKAKTDKERYEREKTAYANGGDDDDEEGSE